MKKYICKYCDKEIEIDTTKNIGFQVALHYRTCEKNPKKEFIKERMKIGSQKMNKAVNERNHQLKILDLQTKSNQEFICDRCGKNFFKELTDREFEKFLDKKHFCSDFCAHTRKASQPQKEKTSESLKKYYNTIRENSLKTGKNQIKSEFTECQFCHKAFKGKNKFCSNECRKEARKILYEDPEFKEKLRNAGKNSAKKRSVRSKNEIAFAELCKAMFKNVECNAPIFNGWDADIIIHDYKLAILWNGPFHYKEIFKSGQTLKRIQNRDKIKEKEILKHGYFPYIIKDLAKFNKNKVQSEFEILLNFIENNF